MQPVTPWDSMLAVFTVEGRVSTRIGPRLPRRQRSSSSKRSIRTPPWATEQDPSRAPAYGHHARRRPGGTPPSTAHSLGCLQRRCSTKPGHPPEALPAPTRQPHRLVGDGWWHTLPVATASHLCADPGGLLERIPSPLTLVRD